jgi:hypothetical protein
MRGGYVCLVLQPINEKKIWQQIIEQILNVLLKYKPISNVKL